MSKTTLHLADNRMYSIREAAAFFSMSRSWIRERVKTQDLDGYLCGNVLISGISINRYLLSRSVRPSQLAPVSGAETLANNEAAPQVNSPHKLPFQHLGRSLTLVKMEPRPHLPWWLRVSYQGRIYARSTGTTDATLAVEKAKILLDAIFRGDSLLLDQMKIRRPFGGPAAPGSPGSPGSPVESQSAQSIQQ